MYQLDLGGQDVTNYLKKLLNNKLFHDHKSSIIIDDDIINEFKKRDCYAALDFEEEMKHTADSSSLLERTLQLPDGQTITINNERFCSVEPLFQPSLVQMMQQPG